MRSFNSTDNYANYITTEDYQMEKLIKLLDKTNSEVHKKDQSFMGPVFSRSIKKVRAFNFALAKTERFPCIQHCGCALSWVPLLP